MNDKTHPESHKARWGLLVPLLLVAASATAQTVVSAEELRASVKQELAPLTVSVKEQAKAVAAELAGGVIRELATAVATSVPGAQLARQGSERSARERT